MQKMITTVGYNSEHKFDIGKAIASKQREAYKNIFNLRYSYQYQYDAVPRNIITQAIARCLLNTWIESGKGRFMSRKGRSSLSWELNPEPSDWASKE